MGQRIEIGRYVREIFRRRRGWLRRGGGTKEYVVSRLYEGPLRKFPRTCSETTTCGPQTDRGVSTRPLKIEGAQF